jgi:VIT family
MANPSVAIHSARTALISASHKRILDPMDRMAEVLCGLIMVMTFTLAMKREGWTVREVLVYSVGCNLAWGIIDGSLYAIGLISERGRNRRALEAIRTGVPEQGYRAIREHLPPLIASVLTSADYERFRKELAALPAEITKQTVTKEALLGGLSVFLLVFLSTFPVVIPFLLMKDVALALSISNAVALAMLFLTGFFYGRSVGGGAWRIGFITLAIGSVLTIIALVLGG